MRATRLQLIILNGFLAFGVIVAVTNKITRFLPDWFIDLALMVEIVGIVGVAIWVILSKRQPD